MTVCRLGRPHPAAKDEDVDDLNNAKQEDEPVHRATRPGRPGNRGGYGSALHVMANPTDFRGPCQEQSEAVSES